MHIDRDDTCTEKEEGLTLDYSELNLSVFPQLDEHKFCNIRHLFISNNNLTFIPDLTYLKHLEVLDISRNKLAQITGNHNNIIELDVSYNNIIDASGLSKYTKLRRFICTHNDIEELTNIERIEYLDCKNNKIKAINNADKCRYMDCSNNNIETLDKVAMSSMIDLIINNNRIRRFECIMPKIKYIELIGNDINYLCFFCGIEEVSLSYKKELNISQHYEGDYVVSVIDNKIVSIIDKKIYIDYSK